MKWREIKKEHWSAYIKAAGLTSSTLESDILIAKELGICEQTLKLLEFCTSYYEYVGIRTLTPGRKKEQWGMSWSVYGDPFDVKAPQEDNKSGRHNGWPAIWRAVEIVGLPGSCGNSHQYQINDALTTGLYKNKNGIWFKQLL